MSIKQSEKILKSPESGFPEESTERLSRAWGSLTKLKKNAEATMLRKGYIAELKSFSESSTAHGLKHVFSEKSSIFRRWTWLLAFLVAVGILTYQLVVCYIDYYKYETKTVTKLTRMSSMNFPTVTICNLNRADASRVKNPQALKDILRVAKSNMWSQVLNISLKDMKKNKVYQPFLNERYKDALQFLMWRVEDLFQHCEWKGMNVPCKEVLTAFMTINGYCYKLNGDPNKAMVSPRSGIKAGFYATMKASLLGHTISDMGSYGFKLVIHSMMDTPDVMSQGIVLSPGFSYRISFRAHQIKYLRHPYKSQGDMYCNDYPPPTMKQMARKEVSADTHSLATCTSKKAKVLASKHCGCTLDNCTFYEHLTCWEPKFTEIYDTASKTDMLGCSIPCTLRSYKPVISQAAFPSPDVNELMAKWGGSSMDKNEHLGVALFFEDLILYEHVHEPVYTTLSLIGVLGGNMGLLIGASVFTGAEIIEFIILSMWRYFYRCEN